MPKRILLLLSKRGEPVGKEYTVWPPEERSDNRGDSGAQTLSLPLSAIWNDYLKISTWKSFNIKQIKNQFLNTVSKYSL
jgi:hypothetical protein